MTHKTIKPELIAKLYTWTINDLGLIYKSSFSFNPAKKLYEGPSNSYALLIAALIDTWGSIIRDKFGKPNEVNSNVKIVLKKLAGLDNGKNKSNYKIFKNGEIIEDVVLLFRHNLVHDFGKKQSKPEYDLNIDSTGLVINQQKTNKRWHINCKKLGEDLANLLMLELPYLLRED